MSQKLCKNKKCQRPLPEGYKYKYCEHCRSERAQQIKRAGKAALGVVVMVGGTAAIPPHFPESNAQNGVVIEAFSEAAKRFSRGGYDVYVDGIVGPWFLEPWLGAARKGYEVHYMVLRASREITLRRAVERSKLDLKTNTELVEIMWEQFCDLGKYEANVIDTTAQTVSETVQSIKAHLKSGQNRIK